MNQSIPIITISALLLFTVLWVTNDDKEQSVKTEIEPIAQSEQEAPEPEAAEFGSAETRVAEEYGRELASLQATERECLALNIYHESRSDNFAGRVAVADVVINRVNSKHFPDTICGVVHQAKTRVNWKGNVVPVRSMCHFSWYCDGMSDEPIEDDAWDDAQIIAEMVQRDGFRGISEGATHYHATYVSPNWTSDRGMVPVGRIGLHKFYRWH